MKIAFVTPFFGPGAKGGAEAECRRTAIHLAAAGIDVHILTTCIYSFQHDWRVDHYRAGTTCEDGITIHRFGTESVNNHMFADLNERIIARKDISLEEERQFFAMHINSFDLYRYLDEHRDDYDWFCLIPYLFGMTVRAAQIVQEKSVLIPCLHDEGYANLSMVAEMFKSVAKVVFHAEAERALARRLYGNMNGRDHLIGEGIDTHATGNGTRFREKYGITEPFIFYAGRKDEEKNFPVLLRYFSFYKQHNHNDLKLVVAGPGSLSLSNEMENVVLDLGYVTEEDKLDAYSAADLFCLPSLNESFSIVIMEAWLAETPCLVHEHCAVTREHVVKSGGGLFFSSYGSFECCVNHILKSPEQAATMGHFGRRYVLENFTWSHIVDRYQNEVLTKQPC
jgi:glycosyltransferase involved in cell wall biosynthesis